MTARMTWISHAATAALRGGVFPADETIDERGRAACAEAAARLRRADRIWTAPELRARETAETLALKAVVAPELRDCDFGRWAGRTLAEIEAEEPQALAAWLTDPHAAPHGGESMADVMHRIGAWFDARTGDPGRSIVITHPPAIRAAVLHVLRADAESFRWIDVPPLSQAVFTRANRDWRFRSLGAVSG